MKYTQWTIRNEQFEAERKRSRDALFTIGNGYFGIRGFFEEDAEGVDSLGGIYMAGIFGKGSYPAWEGESRELCNVTNIFRAVILADGEPIHVAEAAEDFYQEVNLRQAVYKRGYLYTAQSGKKVKVSFERFAGMHNRHLAGQKVTVEAVDSDMEVNVKLLLDSRVTNLNRESCEPFPIQPGRDHIVERVLGQNFVETKMDDVDDTVLSFAQKTVVCKRDEMPEEMCGEYASGQAYKVFLKAGESITFTKMVCAYTSKDEENREEKIREFLDSDISYEEEFEKHTQAWNQKWDISDIQIDTENDDQTVLRYNIFHLLCVCPEQTDRLSIGARGLSGEMYEGCVFWDNEIFKLPFFMYTNPEAARKLLTFRYHTLEAAKRHAKKNWFEGAMYPWQVSEKGIEQTPYNVGAFYAIHIVSDIAYAIKKYWDITGDDEFILQYGAEILVETARFFASRVDYDEEKQKYEIRAVRGPNEYDVYVNNNAYTNMMAAENFRTVKKAMEVLGEKYPEQKGVLYEKLGLTQEESKLWDDIFDKIEIPYDKERKLYLEDDAYLKRRPLDMRKAKPTGKRIIDSTLPYEALPLYQVTKQSDVVLLMDLLPHLFTEEEKDAAYHFYEPRTAHDSSLSYAPYGMLAARIGMADEAYRYFKKSAYLDIEDIQLNTISGLHFANFGGTWQMAYLGYAGISQNDGVLYIEPRLPKNWKEMSLTTIFQGKLVRIQITEEQIYVNLERGTGTLKIKINGKDCELSAENSAVCV